MRLLRGHDGNKSISLVREAERCGLGYRDKRETTINVIAIVQLFFCL